MCANPHDHIHAANQEEGKVEGGRALPSESDPFNRLVGYHPLNLFVFVGRTLVHGPWSHLAEKRPGNIIFYFGGMICPSKIRVLFPRKTSRLSSCQALSQMPCSFSSGKINGEESNHPSRWLDNLNYLTPKSVNE